MTDTGNSNTFTLAAHLEGAMQAKLVKLNRRAKKLGMVPVIAIITNLRQVTCTPDTRGAYLPEGAEKTVRDLLDVTLLGNAPVIEGFTFVASIDCRGETPIVRRSPGDDTGVDLREFYSADPDRCDHCNAKRRRNDVLILRDTSTGKLIQIGRNCAADFFRSSDAVAMVRVYDLYATLGDEGDYDATGQVSYEDTYVDLTRLLEMTAAVVRTFGWVSSKMAFEGDGSAHKTAWRVADNLFCRREMRDENLAHTQEADTALAWKVLAWLTSDFVGVPQAERNEFQHNVCGSIECSGMVRVRNFGYIIWAINGYARHVEKTERVEREKVTAKASAHIGGVGERLDFEAKLVSLKYFESEYGLRTLCRFVDANGNIIIWWATTEPRLTVGNTYRFTATIKKHDTYNGAAQTIITRAKLENEDPAGGE